MGFLAYGAVATYRWQLYKDDELVAPSAYPLNAGGTALLVMGVLVCARVVESSSCETYYRVKPEGWFA